MTYEKAIVPALIRKTEHTQALNIAVILLGVLLLSLLAQVSIYLPFTPVPITGQTFGVFLIALLWGSWRSVTVVAAYLCLGAFYSPVFAASIGGLSWGPTLGYLIGMLFASMVMGKMSDYGWAQSFTKALATCFVGSVIIFGLGLFILSYFVPKDTILQAGLIPFIPGNIIKSLLAASIVSTTSKKLG